MRCQGSPARFLGSLSVLIQSEGYATAGPLTHAATSLLQPCEAVESALEPNDLALALRLSPSLPHSWRSHTYHPHQRTLCPMPPYIWSQLQPALPSPHLTCVRHNHTLRIPRRIQAKRGWVKDSEERDRLIAAISDLDQLEGFWATWGGGSRTRIIGRTSGRQSLEIADSVTCRLSHYNLARFLSKAASMAPASALQRAGVPDKQESHNESEQVWTDEDVERLKSMVLDACDKMRLRGKLCDHRTAGVTLNALARLGHRDDQLTGFLLQVTTPRTYEAYTRQLALLAHALRSLDYREGKNWWSATWSHVVQTLPSDLVFPGYVHRLIAAGDALGHPPPEPVRQWLNNINKSKGSKVTDVPQTPKVLGVQQTQAVASSASSI